MGRRLPAGGRAGERRPPGPAGGRTAAARLIAVFGAWRSLVARTVRVGEVPGSNPGAPISGSLSAPAGVLGRSRAGARHASCVLGSHAQPHLKSGRLRRSREAPSGAPSALREAPSGRLRRSREAPCIAKRTLRVVLAPGG